MAVPPPAHPGQSCHLSVCAGRLRPSPPTGRCVASICKLRPETRRHVQVPAAPGKRSSSAARASPATALSWLAGVSGVGGSHTSTSSPRVPCPRPHGRADGSPGAFRAFVVTSWSPACGSHLTGPPSVPLEALRPRRPRSTELRLRQPRLGLLVHAPCLPRRVPRPQEGLRPLPSHPTRRLGLLSRQPDPGATRQSRLLVRSGRASLPAPPGDHAILRLP